MSVRKVRCGHCKTVFKVRLKEPVQKAVRCPECEERVPLKKQSAVKSRPADDEFAQPHPKSQRRSQQKSKKKKKPQSKGLPWMRIGIYGGVSVCLIIGFFAYLQFSNTIENEDKKVVDESPVTTNQNNQQQEDIVKNNKRPETTTPSTPVTTTNTPPKETTTPPKIPTKKPPVKISPPVYQPSKIISVFKVSGQYMGVTPDSSRIIMSGNDQKGVYSNDVVRVVDLKSGNVIREFDYGAIGVRSVALSLDGKLAVISSREKGTQIADVGSGEILKE